MVTHAVPDSNLDSLREQRFSYSKSDIMHDESRNSWASVDSADSAEETFVPIRVSQSYDTGLDELGCGNPKILLPGEWDRHSVASDGQSMRSQPEGRHSSDMQSAIKPPQGSQQLNVFTSAAKKFLLKKDDSEEDPDALVAEFYKQKSKEETNKQTRELEVGDIIRATRSRTSSPSPQGLQSRGASPAVNPVQSRLLHGA